ncbi:hypothetical protein I5F59_26620, partial [Pseudomonas aeruginosa]|nr:hypothetical protein [Pseudomonas aeruginosa]
PAPPAAGGGPPFSPAPRARARPPPPPPAPRPPPPPPPPDPAISARRHGMTVEQGA